MSINKQLQFVSYFLFLAGWALAGYVEAATRGLQIEVRNAAGQIESKDLYSGYYALVIGIGDYEEWPDLPNAVSDAAEVASMLMNFGWDVELVANPTGYELEKSLFSLAKRARTDTELGILVWYSGHGWTLPEYDGTPLGYLVPSDAPDPKKDEVKFEQTAVDMRTIESVSRRIRSKHVLMVFDSCFSGSVFTLQRSNIPTPYIQDKTLKHVRQYITAGQEDEMVPDQSIFQTVFMQGIKDRYADRNEDGYVTGNELGAYLQEKVINYSNKMQHPQFGKINDPKLDKGDFVFILPKIDASNPQSEDRGGPISEPIDPRVLDLEYWQSIRKLNDPDLFLEYLKAFPNGIYVGLAKIKLQELGVTSAALLQEEKTKREAEAKRTDDVSIRHQGGTYSGEVLDEIPNGQGTWNSPDGRQYVGQWQDGLWHGEGTQSASDGSMSTGEYQNGRRNGQSTWTRPDGSKYVGEFRDDQMHGQGVHTFANGDRYAGTFENGKQHGRGMYTFSDGSVVAGDWKNGKPLQATYTDVSEQEIGQYIDGLWYAN